MTKPYWDAAAGGQLAIQRCVQCGHYSNPPVPMCTECHSSKLEYHPVSGQGVIYARVINHQAMVAGFQDAIPYAIVAVELEEQPGLLVVTNLVDAPPEEAKIGLPVQVTFEPLEGGMQLPQFRPSKSG